MIRLEEPSVEARCCVCGGGLGVDWFVLVLPGGRFYYCGPCFDEGPESETRY